MIRSWIELLMTEERASTRIFSPREDKIQTDNAKPIRLDAPGYDEPPLGYDEPHKKRE